VKRNELNDQANTLFEEIEVFKKEHGSPKSRGLKEVQKQIDHLEMLQQTQVFPPKKNVN
jgi:uncharacterized coiled-coil DUF342 family protein